MSARDISIIFISTSLLSIWIPRDALFTIYRLNVKTKFKNEQIIKDKSFIRRKILLSFMKSHITKRLNFFRFSMFLYHTYLFTIVLFISLMFLYTLGIESLWMLKIVLYFKLIALDGTLYVFLVLFSRRTNWKRNRKYLDGWTFGRKKK